MLTSALITAFFTSTHAATLADCLKDNYFNKNQDDCTALFTQQQSLQMSGFSGAADADPVSATGMSARSADLSGCGAMRICTDCVAVSGNQCFWNPGTGCVKRAANNLAPSVCNAVTNVAPQCEQFTDCKSCTIQNGCVYFRGQCLYSRGTGCQNDPANCISYEWNCPAFPPAPVVPAPYAPPAPVVVAPAPSRVPSIVASFNGMIGGLSVADLRVLRTQIDATIDAAIASAAPPIYNPWAFVTAPNQGVATVASPVSSAWGVYTAPQEVSTNWWDQSYAFTPTYTPVVQSWTWGR